MSITNFKDLYCWKEAHQLVLNIYKISKTFPLDERFSLTNQMRRSAISITSNIAEGFGRSTAKDKLQFYAIAKGSIFELESQLLISKDLGYLKISDFNNLELQISGVGKMIVGMMKSAPSRD
jgi:four helix bundle protein